MTVAAQGKRFCTCADHPTHLVGVAPGVEPLGSSTSLPTRDMNEEAIEIDVAPDIREEPARFCTCSERPTVEVDRRETATGADRDRLMSDEAAVSQADAGRSVTSAGRAQEAASKPDSDVERETPVISSVSDLLPGETALFTSSTHGRGGSEVVLTERRVLLRGAPDADVLHASMRFSEIDSVTVSRSNPSRRSLVWGLVGIAASIGMWQALDGVGNLRLIIGVIVVLMSAVLLADYFLRPPDLVVGLRANSGAEMKIGFGQSHVDEADRFAARVISMMEMRPGG